MTPTSKPNILYPRFPRGRPPAKCTAVTITATAMRIPLQREHVQRAGGCAWNQTTYLDDAKCRDAAANPVPMSASMRMGVDHDACSYSCTCGWVIRPGSLHPLAYGYPDNHTLFATGVVPIGFVKMLRRLCCPDVCRARAGAAGPSGRCHARSSKHTAQQRAAAHLPAQSPRTMHGAHMAMQHGGGRAKGGSQSNQVRARGPGPLPASPPRPCPGTGYPAL